ISPQLTPRLPASARIALFDNRLNTPARTPGEFVLDFASGGNCRCFDNTFGGLHATGRDGTTANSHIVTIAIEQQVAIEIEYGVPQTTACQRVNFHEPARTTRIARIRQRNQRWKNHSAKTK